MRHVSNEIQTLLPTSDWVQHLQNKYFLKVFFFRSCSAFKVNYFPKELKMSDSPKESPTPTSMSCLFKPSYNLSNKSLSRCSQMWLGIQYFQILRSEILYIYAVISEYTQWALMLYLIIKCINRSTLKDKNMHSERGKDFCISLGWVLPQVSFFCLSSYNEDFYFNIYFLCPQIVDKRLWVLITMDVNNCTHLNQSEASKTKTPPCPPKFSAIVLGLFLESEPKGLAWWMGLLNCQISLEF